MHKVGDRQSSFEWRSYIVQWLHANQNEGCTVAALGGGAVKYGHLEMVQWLLEHRSKCTKSLSAATMDLAAECDHLDIVTWLHVNRPKGCTVQWRQWIKQQQTVISKSFDSLYRPDPKAVLWSH